VGSAVPPFLAFLALSLQARREDTLDALSSLTGETRPSLLAATRVQPAARKGTSPRPSRDGSQPGTLPDRPLCAFATGLLSFVIAFP